MSGESINDRDFVGDRAMIPTLGYPSRGEAVMALTAQGLDRFEIAARIGIKPGSVAVHQHYGKRGRIDRSTETCRRVRIKRDALNALASHAAKLGLTVDSLARLILQAVVEGNIVDAVLDDGEGK
jgi:hypothetical protein